MLKLRVTVQEVNGAVSLVYRRAPVRFEGPAEELGGLTPGTEVEVMAAFKPGGLVALGIVGGGSASPEELRGLVTAGRAGEAMRTLERFHAAGGAPSIPHLAVAVEAYASAGQPRRSAEAFRQLLAALTTAPASAHLAQQALAVLPSAEKEELGRAYAEWVATHWATLPKGRARAPIGVPVQLWPTKLLSMVCHDAVAELNGIQHHLDQPWTLEDLFLDALGELRTSRCAELSVQEGADLDQLAARVEAMLAWREELARWGDVGLFEPATVERIAELVGIELPEVLAQRWREARSEVPPRIPGDVATYETLRLRMAPLDGRVGRLRDLAREIGLRLGRVPRPERMLCVLAFAVIGDIEGRKGAVYALDLDQPTTSGGAPSDYVVLEYAYNREDDVKEPVSVMEIASSSAQWVERETTWRPQWAPASPDAEALRDPEALTDGDRARLLAIRDELVKRELHRAPCLTPEELDAHERRHGVRLPSQYRQWLLDVANGGAGPPHYGLVELTDTPGLDRPFGKRGKAVRHGRLYLGTDGCGLDYLLIVSGRRRGEIWRRDGEGLYPAKPRLDFLGWCEAWLNGQVGDQF